MTVKAREGFVRLPNDIVDNDAFAGLSPVATRILILLIRRFNGYNNGRIPCSIREAALWAHCRPNTAMRKFDELERAGLVTMTSKGHFVLVGQSTKDSATRWRVNFLQNRPSRDIA
jgi:hypothetical protein